MKTCSIHSRFGPGKFSGFSPILLISLLLTAASADAASITRAWDGGAVGADANWATAANWTNNVAPAVGDFLVFPPGPAKLVTTNNFAPNRVFNGFTIQDDYTLRGNAVDLTNSVQAIGALGTIDLNLRLAHDVTFDASLFGLLRQNGTLTLNNFDVTFDGVNGNHEVNGLITDVSGAASSVIVSGENLPPPLNTGGNTLVLNGTNNCPGPTILTNVSTLIVNGSITSQVIVATSAILGGSGVVGQLTAAGTVASGNSRLRVSGPCSFASTATYSLHVAGTTPGVNHSQLQCSNTVGLGSSHLQIVRDSAFIPAMSNIFTILDKVSAGAIGGTFSGLPQGGSTNVGGVTYLISYTAGNGNDVTLTVTNLDPSFVTRTWDGGGGNNNWTTALNWDAAVVATNHLLFPRTAGDAICTNDFATDTLFSSLRFTGSANTNNYPLLRGNSIRLLSGIIATNLGSAGAVALDLPIKLIASQTFTNASTNTDIEIRSNLLVHPSTLTIRGAGTFRISGSVTATNNANLVVVNGGHLVNNGSITGNVSVINSGDLAGTGTLGAATVSGGSISPGDSGAGILTLGGALSLNAASSLNIELTNSTPGSGHDQLIVSNANVSLGSAALNLTVSATATDVVGTAFTILKLPNPTNTIIGTFAGVPEGSEVDVAPLRFRISYAGGDGNDVVLTIIGAVPSNQENSGFTGADQGDGIRLEAAQSSISGVTNNHPPGSSFDKLTLIDHFGVGGVGGMTVRGNLLRLERGIVATNHPLQSDICEVTLELPLALNADQTFTHNLNSELVFGHIDLDGHTLNMDVHKFVTVGFDGIRIAGVISGASSASRIIKTGPDPLTLAPPGGTNTYEGTTTVLQGDLILSGTLFSTVIVTTNGILNVGGIVGGILSTSGLIVLGSLQSTGAVVLDPGLQLRAHIGTSGSSLLTCNSSVNLGGSSLVPNVSPTPPGDTNFMILSKTSPGPVTGTFAGLPQNTDFTTNGHHYRITYTGGDGNDVVIITTNDPPVVTPIPNQTIPEQALFNLQITATDADSADKLAYSLDPGSPTNATINATNGLIAWTPTEEQGPGLFNVNVRVTDNGNPVKSSTTTFQVSVLDSNLPPILTVPSTVTSNELTQITFTVSGSDPDNPPDTLTYQLLQNPSGMTLTSTSSASATITWVPAEDQGPSTNNVIVRVTETASGLSTTQSLSVIAREVNVRPVFQPIAGTNVLTGQLIQRALAATDSDIPANPLTFVLITPPAGATIVTNAMFQWTPAANQVGQFTISIRCSDSSPLAVNSTSLSTTQQFVVNVGILRIVTNTNDSGAGSLRQAMTDVTTNTGGGVIQFNIPGSGPQRIAPTNALPLLTKVTVIDGYTQPGSRPNQLTNGTDAVILIELSGENTPGGTGLTWLGQPATIRGLCINRFTNGTGLNSGCSSCGFIATAGSIVEGCFIGTDPSGTIALPNNYGVFFQQTHDARIGGPDIAQRNLISGNLQDAIYPVQGFDGANVFNLTIQNNLIGTDRTGTNALGNGHLGIAAPTGGVGGTGFSAHDCLIADNVFAANGAGGFEFGGSRNLIIRNKIGVGADGITPLGNHGAGIDLSGDHHRVGGTNAADANIIANNSGAGVHVSDGPGSSILGNSFFANSGLGIDLGGIGVTPNDLGDADIGPNDLQNFPVLNAAAGIPGGISISGTLNSFSNANYCLEFFHSTASPAQAKGFIGATNVTTDSGGNVNFSASFPTALPSGFITATATDTNGSTSELSASVSFAANATPPRLDIQNLGSQVRVIWANTLTSFLLETNASLSNPIGWGAVPGPFSNDGQNFFRDFTPTGSALFFRLRSP